MLENEKLIKMNELGLRIVNLSYGLDYADMGDMNDIEQEKEDIINDFKEIFGEY